MINGQIEWATQPVFRSHREAMSDAINLAMAARDVARARRIVAREKERIAQLKADGHFTADYENTLDVFQMALQLFEKRERQLRADIDHRYGPGISTKPSPERRKTVR
jgi:hypothetical protein